LGLLDRLKGRHPDPQVRYEQQQEKNRNKAWNKKEKVALDRIREQAEWKGKIKRAKTEGYKAGLKGKPSRLKKASNMINSIQELTMGSDFKFGTMGSQSSKPRRTSTKASKPKKKKDPWDII